MKKTVAPAALLLCAVLALSSCGAHFHEYTQTVVPPTCRSIGYTMQVCHCGHRVYLDYASVASHEYGEWHRYTESTLISFGEEERVCIHCGNLEIRSTAMLGKLPTVFLTENGSFSYLDGETRSTYQAAIHPLENPKDGKTGYTLSMIQREQVYGFAFGSGSVNEFRLDPCTPDRSFARASAAEQLWQSSLALRKSAGLLPDWFPVSTAENFTVRVFMEEAYLGLYRLIPLDDGLLRQETAAILRAEADTAACYFAEPPSFTQTADAFTLLGYGGSTPDEAKESFAAFSEFIRESSEEEFRSELSAYSDLTALMDYFLVNAFLGLPAGDTAGTLWSTSDGIHWIPSFDSLNNAFALSPDGYQNTALDGIPAPVTHEDGSPAVAYEGSNLLWQKLCRAFPQELIARYATLRDTFLTSENVFDLFMQGYKSVDSSLRYLERSLYAPLPEAAWNTRHVEAYAKKRLSLMDSWLFYAFG